MKIKTKLIEFYKQYRWWNSARYIRKEQNKKYIQIPEFGNILLLMPHSDDEWIGCSQLLARNSKAIRVVDMDRVGGDTADLHNIRREESTQMAEIFHYPLEVVNSTDGLSTVLQNHSPEIVFLPSIYDWHDEHFEVMALMALMIDKDIYKGNVGMYQVSVPMRTKDINYGIPMTKKQQKEKWRLFSKVYVSQKHIPIKRFMYNEYINGALSASYALESYTILSSKDWIDRYKKEKPGNETKKLLLDNINDLKQIRTICEV